MPTQHRILLAAIRLMRSKMRLFVLEQCKDPAMHTLSLLEQDFLIGAEKEWAEVFTSVGAEHLQGIQSTLAQATKEAQREVVASLGPQVPNTAELLNRFSFEIQPQ